MVVISIIALLVTFLVLGFSGVGQSARTRATRALILQLAEACDRFQDTFGFYPPDTTGSSGIDPFWDPGDALPWNDDERCIFASDARVDSSSPDSDHPYIGLLEYLGLANPSDTVESGEALTFCLLLEKRGGPFITVEQKRLANWDDDTYQPYLDEDNDGQYDGASEDLGSPAPLLEIVDAWGTPFRYRSPTGRNQNALNDPDDDLRNPTAVEFYSAGPNREFGWDEGDTVELDGDDIAGWQGPAQ